MLSLILRKEMIYPFNSESLQKIKIDEIKGKVNVTTDIIFYAVIAILLIQGIIGSKFIINYVACSGTAKFVQWLVK